MDRGACSASARVGVNQDESNEYQLWATFTISLDKQVAIATSVRYATANGTAIAGQDYTAAPTARYPESVTFAPSDTEEYVFLPVIDEFLVEAGSRRLVRGRREPPR